MPAVAGGELAEELHLVWRALADPSRRRLLDLLREGPRTTGDLAEQFEATRFATMKHLKVLEEANLVIVQRRGRERWNYLNAVPIRRVYERWISPYQDHWASGLLRLKNALESSEDAAPMADPAQSPTPPVHSFAIRQEVLIAAPPARVFEALTRDLGCWWGPPYVGTEEPQDILVELAVGGRVWESSRRGGGYLWGIVTGFEPGRWFEFTGSLLMAGAVHAVVCFTLHPAEAGTRLELVHEGIGPVADERVQGYSGGWKDLLETRLRAFVERGENMGLRK